MAARVGARWRGRRGQGDGGGGLHGVVHGQDQAGAPDCHFVFRQSELVIHAFVERASPRAGGGGALAVDGAGSRGVRGDGDVGVHGAHAAVVQVGVVVVELTFILARGDGRGRRDEEMKREVRSLHH